MSKDGPHPLLINSPGGGFWIENGEYESARATSGFFKASEISTEHFRVETDPLMFAYMRNFLGKVCVCVCGVCGVCVWCVYVHVHVCVYMCVRTCVCTCVCVHIMLVTMHMYTCM